eukprot:jgi/Chrzof1/10358/Cz04g39010.t1
MCHGAGGTGVSALATFGDLSNLADKRCILLAPDSRGRTWDMIRGGFGPDVRFIDQALAHVFDHYNVDPQHISVAGFSDGASYALSLGISNGDLMSHIIAFSPGFMRPPQQVGQPKMYISHGIHDSVLPISNCSRRLLPQLKAAGYDFKYVEFDGPHTVPLKISKNALDWFIRDVSSKRSSRVATCDF